jgi:hypothetical protein
MAEEATGTEVQTAEVEATGTTVSESGRKRITGTIMSELQTELVANKFEESCIKAITDLMRGLMTVVDEAVAKNALKPELRGIQLERKTNGSPFFSVLLDFEDKVQPEEVSTITSRTQAALDQLRTPGAKKQRLRAIDLSKDHDGAQADE